MSGVIRTGAAAQINNGDRAATAIPTLVGISLPPPNLHRLHHYLLMLITRVPTITHGAARLRSPHAPPANKMCVGARGAQGLFPVVLQCHLEALRGLAAPEQASRTCRTPAFDGGEGTLPLPVSVLACPLRHKHKHTHKGVRKEGRKETALCSCVQVTGDGGYLSLLPRSFFLFLPSSFWHDHFRLSSPTLPPSPPPTSARWTRATQVRV